MLNAAPSTLTPQERAAKAAADRREAAEAEEFRKAKAAAEAAAKAEERAASVAQTARKAYKVVDRVRVALKWASPNDSPPAYLTLGITIDGLSSWVASLPPDAAEQFLHTTPDFYQTGGYGFANPGARHLDGYVAKHFLELEGEEGGFSACERLQHSKPKHVGPATVYVSCPRRARMATLIDGLEAFLCHHQLARDTAFWLFDFSARLNERGVRATVKHLEFIHEEVGRTVMLLDPWHEPHALRRASCLCEALSTARSGTSVPILSKIANRFELVMTLEQRSTFEWALHHDFSKVARDRSGTRPSALGSALPGLPLPGSHP